MSTTTQKLAVLVRTTLQAELESLAKAGIRKQRSGDFGDLRVTELTANDLDAVLSLAKYDDIENLACGYFTGTERLELALRVSQHVHAVPVAILHLVARTAQEPQVRYGALKVAGQVHADPTTGADWDSTIARTIETALRDDEPAIRLEAAAAAIRVAGGGAGPLLDALLERESEQVVRSAVQQLLAQLPDDRAEHPSPRNESVTATRLAFPICTRGDATNAVRTLDALAEPQIADQAEGVRVYELRAEAPQQARMRCLVDERRGAACAYFDGDEAALMALEFTYKLHFLPTSIVIDVALSDLSTRERMSAIVSLAMASSARLLPHDGEPVRELLPVLGRLATDDQVKEIVAAARTLLASEPS